MLDRISHIGIIVNDMDKALSLWRDVFGLKQSGEAKIEVEGIHSVFLSVSGKTGEMTVELMEPLDKDDMSNPVARRLRKSGEGFYHLAVTNDDIPASSQALKDAGLRVIDRPPTNDRVAGRWLVHPKDANGVMVEGLEEWGGDLFA